MTPNSGPDIASTSKRGDMMRKVLFVVVLVLLREVSVGNAGAKDVPTPASRMASNVAAAYTEMLRTVVHKVKEQGYVAIPDNSTLASAVEELIKDKVLGLTAEQRQKLVKDTIGAEDYSTLVQILVKQLGSSDRARQESALRSLGCPLFAREATDQLKTFIFQKDRMTQLRALEALVCLDVPGANHLLDNLIVTGLLSDYDTARAIHVLYISNDADLDAMAMALLKMKPGGRAFRAMLPVLKKRPDYRQIVGEVFRSNLFSAPDKEKLTLDEISNINAENALLEEIFSDPGSFVSDETIKKKLMTYASNRHQLYTMALLILEKSGEDLTYFAGMQKDSQLPAKKRHVLEEIVSRIQKGERLK